MKAQVKAVVVNYSGLSSIKKWFDAEPPSSRYQSLFGWVEWIGGPKEPPVGSKAEIRDSFYVVIVYKNADAELAEKTIMGLADKVETAFIAAPSLGGSVARSYITNREKQKIFQGDYNIVAVRITLLTHRRE